MKECSKCKTENPQHANFCRVCGKQFENTTEKLPTINTPQYKHNNILDSLRPVNDKDFNYFDRETSDNMKVAAPMTIVIPLIVFIVTEGEGMYITPFLGIPFVAYIIYKITRWANLRNKFKKNVDFIENGETIVRVAKGNFMGLYERPYSVILQSQYSKITSFDENHFLLEQNEKKGLYSITYKRIIVPVLYDSISPFNNYITTAVVNGSKRTYDVMGNMR